MVHESLKTAAEILALRSVDSLVEGAAVCLFASLLLRMIPRANAASRFAVWFCALLAIGSFPVFAGMGSPSAGLVSSAAEHAAIRVPESWAVYFLFLWASVAVWLMMQVVRSLWRLTVLRRSCVPVDPVTLDSRVQETLRKHGANRKVTFCTSKEIRVPAALGLWRPAVVVPEWALKELSPDQLNHVLLHELAHLQRWDDWTHLTQQVLQAVLFFHPAVWWIERKAALEREMACDDAVLAETDRPRAYAECLARLAEKSLAHRSLAMAQAALGKVRQMSTRVARILDGNRPAPTGLVWRPAASLVAIFAVGCAVCVSRTPKLLAFESPVSSSPTLMADAPVARFVPAEFKQTSAPVHATELKFRETRSLQAKVSQRPAAVRAKATVALVPKTAGTTKNLIHLAGAKSTARSITETMWIVVERNESAASVPIVQIEMWRVTILHLPAGDSTPRVPRKI